MNARKRKSLRGQLRKYPRGKLLALAVQKGGMSLIEARGLENMELARRLCFIEDLLKPEQA